MLLQLLQVSLSEMQIMFDRRSHVSSQTQTWLVFYYHTGIGITPTLSLMLSYAGKKRINIIWMCRDAGLIEYFLHKLDIFTVTKNSFALIYYTGRQELVLPNNLPLNFFIFQYRPNLEQVSPAKGLLRPKL